jgi:hypothetical protein
MPYLPAVFARCVENISLSYDSESQAVSLAPFYRLFPFGIVDGHLRTISLTLPFFN